MSVMLPEWAVHRARGMMVVMLLLGAAFAIGHHLFYQSLSGKPPPNSAYFSSFAGGLTGQQFNLAAGSVFAFLVNSALGAAITTAADQALWTAVRTKSSKLGVIDNLATTTSSIWSMFDFRLWKKSPTRMVLATIFWLLSVTSFITPATLNVGWSVVTSMMMARVPQVDFTSLNFANIEGSRSIVYNNPQYSILQSVAGSTMGGHILPISSPHQNATWLLEFHGPALSCERINKQSALYNNIGNNILTTMVADGMWGNSSNFYAQCVRSYGYISWVPIADIQTGVISPLPFPNSTNDEPGSKSLGPMVSDPKKVTADEVLTLYAAALPGMIQDRDPRFETCMNINDDLSVSVLPFASAQLADMTITRCIMHNTSYIANFTYINGIQSVKLATKGSLNNVTARSSLGPLDIGGTRNNSTIYNVQAVENIAYQSVMDAFGRMFVGSIAYEFPRVVEKDSMATQTIDTQMVLTPLLGTADYSFLQPFALEGNSSGMKSRLAPVEDGTTLWNGFSAEHAPTSTILAASVMEELFQNATISLMSIPMLQPNYSSPDAPPETAITLTTYAVIYSYAAQTLWLAYGIALGMTFLSILLGVVSIYYNGGSSYMTKFSTILRTAHYIDLSEPIRPEDTDGKDPTPRYIKNLTISFPPAENTVPYRKVAVVTEEEQLQQRDDN